MNEVILEELHKDVMNLVAKYIMETKDVTITFEQICKLIADNQSSIFKSS